jgi:hypothetical protein
MIYEVLSVFDQQKLGRSVFGVDETRAFEKMIRRTIPTSQIPNRSSKPHDLDGMTGPMPGARLYPLPNWKRVLPIRHVASDPPRGIHGDPRRQGDRVGAPRFSRVRLRRSDWPIVCKHGRASRPKGENHMFKHVARAAAATVLTASFTFVVACGGSPSSTGQGSANSTSAPTAADYEKAYEANFDQSSQQLTKTLSTLVPDSKDIAAAEKSYDKKNDSVTEFQVTGDLPFYVIDGQADESHEVAIFDDNGTLVASGIINGDEGTFQWDDKPQAESHL